MQVEVQYFNILNVVLTRDEFSSGGGAPRTTDPPATIGTSSPAFTAAQVPNNGSLYATYTTPSSPSQVGFIISGSNNAITARGESQNPHVKVGTAVSSSGAKFTVAVTFKSA